jgi:inner membrane protein
MPTPIGHALAGIAVAGVAGFPAVPGRHVAILAFCAAAPDLDLVLRLVDGVNHHRGASHSLGAAVLVGALAFFLRRLGCDLPGALPVGAAWASHVLLDFLGLDTSPPEGVMALWPFSNDFRIAPFSIFLDIPRSFTVAAIRHNLVAVAIEIVILTPIAWLSWGRPGIRRNEGS